MRERGLIALLGICGLLITGKAVLWEEEGWKDLAAVREKNYAFLPKELFHFKPNARWAEAYAYLAELLYPELMK